MRQFVANPGRKLFNVEAFAFLQAETLSIALFAEKKQLQKTEKII